MSAKRPDYYQQRTEEVQRQLEISNNLLEKSRLCVQTLKEKLDTQHDEASKETTWLRAKLKENSRSTGFRAKHRLNRGAKAPAWGIRCACTEPEIAYALKDQSPRIVELEAIVVARDLTITNLRESRSTKTVSKNGAASTSNAATSLPSTEDSNSDYTAGSGTATTTLVHAYEHGEQCRNLSKKVADDAKNIEQLREECQKLRDAASNDTTVDVPEITTGAGAGLDKELDTKKTVIQDLQTQLTARNETIDNLTTENTTANDELAKNSQTIKDLRDEKAIIGEELDIKKEEVDKLREEKTVADENTRTEISNLSQRLSESRKELEDAREEIKQKDREIDELEDANQEIAGQPDPESARRLTTANNNLDELRRESETQAVRISELEAANRNARAVIKARDDRIANLERQAQSHAQSHDAAIRQRDEHYQALHESYERIRLAEAQHNADVQTLTTIQQSDTAKQLELQRVWNEYQNVSRLHGNCDRQINDLTNQLRQGANVHTDLQTNYTTQATELEGANQNARELQSEVFKLRQTITSLEQMSSSSESNFEKYRIEGETRARPIWQANFDREMTAQASKLEASEGQLFKLKNQLQQAKNETNPLREMQIKEREDAVRLREEALKSATDSMDHDQQGSRTDPEIKELEGKLTAANKEANDAKARNRGIQTALNREKKERIDEQARHEKALKNQQEDSKKSIEMLKVRLEKDNPLKGAVSKLQNDIMRLSKELEEQKKARGNDG